MGVDSQQLHPRTSSKSLLFACNPHCLFIALVMGWGVNPVSFRYLDLRVYFLSLREPLTVMEIFQSGDIATKHHAEKEKWRLSVGPSTFQLE